MSDNRTLKLPKILDNRIAIHQIRSCYEEPQECALCDIAPLDPEVAVRAAMTITGIMRLPLSHKDT